MSLFLSSLPWEREQEVCCPHQKAGELGRCGPASPSDFCVPLTDRAVQDLLSLQTPPDCTQLIDFKLIALPMYNACWGSQCFAVFGFYPSVYSEITLMVLLLSLMPLYLNSNHRKFDYGLKLHRCLFCLSLCHWVPALPSVCMGLRHLGVYDRGGITLQKDPPAPAQLSLMFGVQRAQLRHSWLNLLCKTRSVTWTFSIFNNCIWMLQIVSIFQSFWGRARRVDISLLDT